MTRNQLTMDPYRKEDTSLLVERLYKNGRKNGSPTKSAIPTAGAESIFSKICILISKMFGELRSEGGKQLLQKAKEGVSDM